MDMHVHTHQHLAPLYYHHHAITPSHPHAITSNWSMVKRLLSHSSSDGSPPLTHTRHGGTTTRPMFSVCGLAVLKPGHASCRLRSRSSDDESLRRQVLHLPLRDCAWISHLHLLLHRLPRLLHVLAKVLIRQFCWVECRHHREQGHRRLCWHPVTREDLGCQRRRLRQLSKRHFANATDAVDEVASRLCAVLHRLLLRSSHAIFSGIHPVLGGK
mmetsp:Transcript_39937/g.90567  ORF Transcript_39937/g.90567 Transcript_39937/m.90567 type:complete len:214 (+) Transcript_39937:279-920(+)